MTDLSGYFDDLTRIVVIGEDGRQDEFWADQWLFTIQDDGRTLKVRQKGAGAASLAARNTTLAVGQRVVVVAGPTPGMIGTVQAPYDLQTPDLTVIRLDDGRRGAFRRTWLRPVPPPGKLNDGLTPIKPEWLMSAPGSVQIPPFLEDEIGSEQAFLGNEPQYASTNQYVDASERKFAERARIFADFQAESDLPGHSTPSQASLGRMCRFLANLLPGLFRRNPL